MLLRISLALCVVVLTYFQTSVAEGPVPSVITQTALVDTLVCPQQDHLSVIIDQGLSEETLEVCSLISWQNVEVSIPLQTYENVGYGAWLSGESEELLTLSVVTVYKVKLDAYKLYALRDPFMEVHFVQMQEAGEMLVVPKGLRSGIAYEHWQTTQPPTLFGDRVVVAEAPH